MKRSALIAIGAAVSATGAPAADREVWQSVTAVGAQEVLYSDYASIERSDGTVTANFLMIPSSSVQGGPKPVLAIGMRFRYDCRNRTAQKLSVTPYTEDGAGAPDPAPASPPQAMPDGSVGAALLDYACSGRRSVNDPWMYATWRQAYDAARKFFDHPQ